MGDFTDLVSLMPLVAQAGAAMVGLNPLHALYPHNPEHASPYSPSSRLFGNSLYLDVEAIPEFAGSLKARQQVADPGFQAELIRLRGLDQVDYTGVSRLKMAVLETLHAQFLQSSQDDPGGDRARAYASFCHDHGTALYRHALFEAIQEHLFASDPSVWGWPAWPTAFHDPDGAAVARFAAEHPDRIGFYQYLQWEFSRQLMAVQASAREAGMPIGLYLDLAVSIDAGGAEAWSQQDLYAAAASAGCPPDDFNLNGQDWGLLPAIPQRLLETGFASFIAVLRAAMSGAGAVRLDHVMGLARLFWVPRGKPGTLGTYMTYPFEPLMAIVTLESQRHRCLVIGEDLGTVSDEVRISMQMSQTLSYRVLYFSFEGADHLLPPEAFPADALVTCTTHDLATLPGYWLSRDLEWRERLNLFPQPDMIGAQRDARDHQKQALLTALVQAGLWNGPDSAIMVPDPSFELVVAVYSYLARSPARLMAVQPEDVFGCLDQVNLPGTVTEYDNWRRRLPVPLEAWQRDGRFVTLGQAIARQGRGNDLTG
jgi:(1->4)-alpha-D-glucan 1-alpha-D-glucosylmutase